MNLDFIDSDLTDTLNRVVSGLLPHEKYVPETFVSLFPVLKTVIPTNDARGTYYVMFTIFDKYIALANSFPAGQFKVSITRERFVNAVENNLPDLVQDPKSDINRLMTEEGKSSDITIPTVQDEAMGVLFEKTMALYDLCYEMERSAEDALSDLIPLKDCIRANMIETCMTNQRTVLSIGMRVGRKSYRGTKGWLEYTSNSLRELTDLDYASQEDLVCNDVSSIDLLREKCQELHEPVGLYGIPPIDASTPMMAHRLVTFVARENTGKTKVMVNLIASLIRAGKKVYYFCGETPKESILIDVASSYIYQEYGLFFEASTFFGAGFKELTTENKQIVSSALARVTTSGLVVSNVLEYDTVTPTISHYATEGYEAFFIDHSQSLRGRKGRKIGDLVTGLALDCREMKNMYPIYIAIASHPSTGFKDLLQKGDTNDTQLSVTAQSAALSQESDEIFILHEDDYLKKQNLLAWTVNKRRGPKTVSTVYIRKEFGVSAYYYDPKDQGAEAVDNDMLNSMIGDAIGEDEEVSIEDQEGLELNF